MRTFSFPSLGGEAHYPRVPPMESKTMAKPTWFHDVYEALRQLGGNAHLSKIYNRVRTIRRNAGRTLPKHFESVVRTTLEDRCREAYFRTGLDIFFMLEGKGAGVWGIRHPSLSAEQIDAAPVLDLESV
jgi:hypothetical protein